MATLFAMHWGFHAVVAMAAGLYVIAALAWTRGARALADGV
jgi:hypothetical protein